MSGRAASIRSFYGGNQTDRPVLNRRLRTVADLVVARRPGKVLDIGCGRGVLLTELARRLPQLKRYGMDIAADSVASARTLGIEIFSDDIADGIPLGDGEVDCVVFGEVIEHIFDPDAALDEIRRVLAPGGLLVVTTPNLASWTNRILLAIGVQPLFTETSTRKKYGRGLRLLGQASTEMQGHLRIFTQGALVEMMRDCGFRVERVIGTTFDPFEALAPLALVDRLFCARSTFASELIAVGVRD